MATSNIPPWGDSWNKIEHFIEVNQESSVEPDQRTQKGDHHSSCASHRLWNLSWIIAVLLLQPVDQDHVSLLRLRRRGGGILIEILLPCIVLGFSLYPIRLASYRPLVKKEGMCERVREKRTFKSKIPGTVALEKSSPVPTLNSPTSSSKTATMCGSMGTTNRRAPIARHWKASKSASWSPRPPGERLHSG